MAMLNPPALSILVPVAPRAPWLDQALDSVVAQVFEDWELVIVLDGACEVNEATVRSRTDPTRTTLVTNAKPRGVARALNLGLSAVTGDLVARLDADDVAEPQRLGCQVDALRRQDSVLALGTAATLIDEVGRTLGMRTPPVGTRRVRRALLTRNCVIHPSVMMRTQAVRAVGGYRSRAEGVEDYDLWLRLLPYGEIDNLPDVLLRYRIHTGQVSPEWQPRGMEPLLREARRAAASPNLLARVDADMRHGLYVAYHHLRARRYQRQKSASLGRYGVPPGP